MAMTQEEFNERFRKLINEMVFVFRLSKNTNNKVINQFSKLSKPELLIQLDHYFGKRGIYYKDGRRIR